jgi:hypothetical protein
MTCSPRRLRLPSYRSGSNPSGRLKEDHVKNLKDLWEKAPELVDCIGGEQLAGSGFEYEQPDTEFVAPNSGEEGKE